jgi:hypothetical protein
MGYFYLLNIDWSPDQNKIIFWKEYESEFDSILVNLIINIFIIFPANLFLLLCHIILFSIIVIPALILLLYEGLKKCDECLSPKPVSTVAINKQIPEIVVRIIPDK